MSKCNSCNANIEWVTTENGKKMPVNPQEIAVFPDSHGDYVGITADGQTVRGILAMKGSPGSYTIRISHFATCAKANQHRRNSHES